MKIGVVGASHGELENLRKAAEFLVTKHNVEIIIHLGDDYDDAKILEDFNVKTVKVPGVYSSYYHDKDIPNRIIENFNDKKVLITHTVHSYENDIFGDLNPDELVYKKAIDVVLYGHTHIPRIEWKHGILYVNPGHLKTRDKKNYPATVAVIDFRNRIRPVIYKLIDRTRFIL